MASPKYSVLQVKPAKDSLIGQSAFIQFLASLRSSLRSRFFDRLLGTHETICLEIINLSQTTFFAVSCPERLEHLVKSQLASQFPNALITPMEEYLPTWLNHGKPLFGRLVLTGPSYLPINATDDPAVDQMAAILGGLSRLSLGQAAIIQICLFAAPKGWQKAARGLLESGVSSDPLKFKAHPQKTLIETKLAYQAYATDIRVAAITPDEDHSKQLLTQIAAAFGTFTSSEGNGLKLKIPKIYSQEKLKNMMLERSAKYASQNQFLNYYEISALFHLPNANLASLKNIAWGKTLKGEPPANLCVDEGLTEEEKKNINFFARTEYKNHMATFGMKKGDDRRRHIYILGKSGTGKSTLIANMAINDIRHGEGIALVDPHGDTAEKLLDYIPDERIDDVAYLDPSTTEKSFRMNPLFVKNPAYAELVASGIVSIFSKLYGNSWGPRLEYILRNTLLTLVAKPGATLLDVPRLLTNKDFREDYLLSVKDAVLVNFWHDEYDKYSEKFQSEAISPILNKVGQFITSPTIRDIISHPTSTVDFEDLMNQGKIIILNLPQGKIGEDNAALLGAMFISQIQIAAMNRANIPEEERKDFFLYVDEFQNFATTSFIKILSEARKYRLNLILANQYTAQLPEEIQKAIFGNAGTLISFVVGADDANRLMNELGNFYTQDDLVSLPKYQVLTKLSVNSTISMPFPAYTLPVPKVMETNKDRVIAASESKYYRVVEPIIMPPPSAPAPRPPQRRDYQRPPEIRPSPRPYQEPHTVYSPPVSQVTPSVSRSEPVSHPVDSYIPKNPTLEELDNLRKAGLRPSVVGCFINNKKILLVYQKVHNLWQLPQGGIDNGQNLEQAFSKEMSEEVTEDFFKNVETPAQLIAEDKIEFPPSKQNLREMKSDAGEPLQMKGKYYYFMVANSKVTDLTIGATEFDDYKWLNYDEAVKLIKDTNTGGKLRITNMILNRLKDKNLIEFINYDKTQDGPKSNSDRPNQHQYQPGARYQSNRPGGHDQRQSGRTQSNYRNASTYRNDYRSGGGTHGSGSNSGSTGNSGPTNTNRPGNSEPGNSRNS